MTKLDWENITNYIDSVGTTDTVFPFIKAQSSVKVTASGARDNIIYTIGGQSGTLLPGQSVTVTGSISSMTLRSASGRQPFHVWATEAGTEKDQTDTSYQGQIDGLTTKLAQKATQLSVERNRRMTTEKISKSSKIDSFVNGLNDWIYTNGITINSGMLNNTINKGNHLNVALYRGIPNARGIEITLGSGGNPAYVRFAFGKDVNNFCYGVSTTTADLFRIAAGVLEGSQKSTSAYTDAGTIAAGTKVKAVLHDQNIQVFINNVLEATFDVAAQNTYFLPSNVPIMAGIAWRDPTTNYFVSQVKVFPKVIDKYIHLSVDDFISSMKGLTVNSAVYSSLFQQPLFAFLKQMHDQYGAVFTLNLFTQDTTGWNMSSMTTKYKDEFRKNASWLRFAFHAYDFNCNYSDGSIDSTTALAHYNEFVTNVKNFASAYNIDTIGRVHSYSGNIATARAWRDTTYGMQGFLSADDNRAANYYLNTIQNNTLQQCDDFFDAIEKLYFVKSVPRLDGMTGVYSYLDSFKANIAYAGQLNAMAIFCHEGSIQTSTQNFSDVCQWAADNGYIFAFPMDYIPEC